MAVAPTPDQVYARAKEEGQRRLSMPPLMQASTGFIAGVTIVFGITALGLASSYTKPHFGEEFAHLVGALGFGVGVVFLVVGRSELFTENFFDPVASAVDRRRAWVWVTLARLWGIVLVSNLLGGAAMVAIFCIEGTLPPSTHQALVTVAEDIADKTLTATLARAVAAGALLTLLSYLLNAVDSVTSRIAVSYVVGVFLALGPFDHVVVSALHLLFGVWLGGSVGYADVLRNVAVTIPGNLAGGLVLMTLTHVVQEMGARRESG